MPIQKIYLGWNQPALPSVAKHLAEHYLDNQRLDLAGCILVVPGRLARRQLLRTLLELAGERSLEFRPPEIVTLGNFPEMLYAQQRPVASDLIQRLAWVQALQTSSPETLQGFTSQVPTEEDLTGWRRLARMLSRLHNELSSDGFDFAMVAKKGGAVSGFTEQTRWHALAKVQQRYLSVLDDLEVWDVQTARQVAIQNGECGSGRDVFLVGMADMNQTQRQMLAQISDRVTAFVHAPQELADRFDEFGCVLPEAWLNSHLNIRDEQICLAQNVQQQAAIVMRCLAEYQGRYRADQITIGVPDQQIVPRLQQELDEHGLRGRWLWAKELPQTGPYQLLAAVGNYLFDKRTEDFAALVRHPDLANWLTAKGIAEDWLLELDHYLARHLPLRMGESWLGPAQRRNKLEQAFTAIDHLLGDLGSGNTKPLTDWATPVGDLLTEIYGVVADNTDRVATAACEKIAAVVIELAGLPAQVSPNLTAGKMLDLVLEQLTNEGVAAEEDAGAIEILGWLELPLDDTPAVVVTTFNERFVPKSICGDLFLPDALRRKLGLSDNQRRYARDAYAVEVLLNTRETVHLVMSRYDTDGNPLTPSRFLFAATPETIARRVIRLYDADALSAAPNFDSPRFSSTRNTSDFSVPDPACINTPEKDSLRVTDFKRYLACPYRFFLERCLKLELTSDRERELDALQFGQLIHEVLKKFGNSEIADSTNPDDIRDCLLTHLGLEAKLQYGSQRRGAINVQIAQAEERLRAFAAWQAAWRSKGWQIKNVEASPGDEGVAFDVDGKPVYLHGRLDRVDMNDNGEIVIFDYKTSREAQRPEKTHQARRGEWSDLQLPLYRHLAAGLGITGKPQLGYVALPEDTAKTVQFIANWSDADLEDADNVAREVVRKIRRREFWPPADMGQNDRDPFSSICMTGVFERPVVGEHDLGEDSQ
ncbi:MAG: PD-(D/E)XK nuclease family protein [Pirellulales bacterium]|nr:PD-(D/E)XK nuclease family protein [Pirellulales bacterium]